jgi:uncharacterized protein (TIGR00251 family)
LRVTAKDGALRFEVVAKPRSARSRIAGVRAEALLVELAAPPVDGAANEELVATLARELGLPKRAVELLRGATSRTKLVAVRGLDEAELRARVSARARGA